MSSRTHSEWMYRESFNLQEAYDENSDTITSSLRRDAEIRTGSGEDDAQGQEQADMSAASLRAYSEDSSEYQLRLDFEESEEDDDNQTIQGFRKADPDGTIHDRAYDYKVRKVQ